MDGGDKSDRWEACLSAHTLVYGSVSGDLPQVSVYVAIVTS